MNPPRSLIFAFAGSDIVRRFVTAGPGCRGRADSLVAGASAASAVDAAERLAGEGLRSTLAHLGERTPDRAVAEQTVREYLGLLDLVYARGLSAHAEVSLTWSAVGGLIDDKLALDNIWRLAAAAEQCDTTVTFDVHGPMTDAGLRSFEELRHTWPRVGIVLRASSPRAEADTASLTAEGTRVRLRAGAVETGNQHEIDLSYVRCANVLLAGDGHPMFATHDRRLIDVLTERARWYGRKQGEYEFQQWYGVRPAYQRGLAEGGETVRIHVPYGEQWYGHFLRRLTEPSADAKIFLRALASRS
ncbi:MAG: proline dehydrogenase [Amycolatopsis sp.]|uniref:proline dehydrogenase family protein n=1 Tax=Amycolatopsis sp. TaxID=37632 RepID=UPI00260EC442|nr:proline dehydrogenase family protein [Amycolatopsis sp.]MCU1684852.1 proline dehydrogenase [Amycolatopsis sp.]